MKIIKGIEAALDALDLQDISTTPAGARSNLAPLLASTAGASERVLSASGHALIDSACLWPIRESVRQVARSISSALELLGTDPEFIFGMSSAQQYKRLKEQYPDLYERVKDAVAQGRLASGVLRINA
ncbi:MAG: hypothetical protein ABWX63_06970 [Paeniglutamicibacter terrestris]